MGDYTSQPSLPGEFAALAQRIAALERRAEPIRGEVAADGSITRGNRFTVVHNGAGDYSVTFDQPFAATPVVVLGSGATGVSVFAKLHASTPPSDSSFRVAMLESDTEVLTDAIFDFIAMEA